ncbi:Glycosyltransferase 92 family protein [Acanthocheilonema viteae]
MRARSAITLSVPRIHLLLRFMLGVLLVSLSITTSLLSITVFLLRERFSQPWRNLRDSIASDEDSFSCKLHVSNLQRPEEFTVRNLTSKSLIIIRSVLLLQHRRLYLKILFLKKCETNISDIQLQIDLKQTLCPVVRHIESDNCPWDWAPGCAWSSFIATARLDFVPNRILLNFNNHTIGLNLEPSHNIENLPFAVCIQPLYWYVDWLQVIEFIEIWTSQGVNHFFFYFYTVSQLVMDILQYYEAKGTVTLLPWRSFPVGENENPNRDVYRLAHSLANNDCLWRSYGAHFVAFVDLDEYILTANGMPLINFIKRKAELCPKCGSFAVMHSKMYYSSPRPQNDFHWRDIRFEWLTNISYGLPEANGPHKQIVRPETVSVISTHSTRRNFPGYIDVSLNSSEIILLHSSYKWSETNPPLNNVTIAPYFFDHTLPVLKRAYREIGQLLFKNKIMKIDRMSQIKIAKCISRWRIRKCKSVDMCKIGMKWIHAENFSTDEYQVV